MEKYVRNMDMFKKDIEYVQGIIPELGSSNFDRNLCNLTISVNRKAKNYISQYEDKKNNIELVEKSIKKTKKGNEEGFSDYFNFIIRYDLLQVASTRYDNVRDVLYSGFSKEYFSGEAKDISEKHNNLNIGFINYLLSNDYKYNQTYALQKHFVGQLTEIVGIDVMKYSFFNNKGISPIKDKLSSINISAENIYKFFCSFEKIESACYTGDITTLVPNIQSLLIDFYSKKVESLSSKEDAILFKNNFVKMVDDTMNYGMYFVNHLHPKDSSFSLYEQNNLKSKVKTI